MKSRRKYQHIRCLIKDQKLAYIQIKMKMKKERHLNKKIYQNKILTKKKMPRIPRETMKNLERRRVKRERSGKPWRWLYFGETDKSFTSTKVFQKIFSKSQKKSGYRRRLSITITQSFVRLSIFILILIRICLTKWVCSEISLMKQRKITENNSNQIKYLGHQC